MAAPIPNSYPPQPTNPGAGSPPLAAAPAGMGSVPSTISSSLEQPKTWQEIGVVATVMNWIMSGISWMFSKLQSYWLKVYSYFVKTPPSSPLSQEPSRPMLRPELQEEINLLVAFNGLDQLAQDRICRLVEGKLARGWARGPSGKEAILNNPSLLKDYLMFPGKSKT